ncbi:FliM/FliN family flagellar motor switch protein [Kluyvera ascorbata]|jgi:flagellar motor switch protein FliN/FliY|uniref:Flagellar motor switch protein FliN n=1 Tax=Kluyvera ascorbata TaxID=51288 RepID=A0AB35X892_9ENTR|nr:FliM/FliN family flagellar motor switch protein [Kluyvera ascorbata]MDT8701976.1 FliM/FliN family flagellar motor switch protein [Kluyvera ascorbata]HDG1670019.1 FliM/FliN family flagellar motor switch protein [Kluyvera ascorbata]
MSKQEDILEQGFELNTETTKASPDTSVAEKLVTRLEDRFSESMTLLKRIPVTLTLEVSSVEIMLADLLNIDDDTVIEMDKLAGEPLDIKVNNILLGKAEVVVVNEKYGLRVLEFNANEINDLTP